MKGIAIMEIDNVFTYHAPIGNQTSRYETIRKDAKKFAKLLFDLCPHSAERTLALRDLQRCVMMANASIAVNEGEGTCNRWAVEDKSIVDVITINSIETKAINRVGKPVVLINPDVEGEIDEVIFDRQRNILYKVKFWIQGEANYHVCTEKEIKFL